MYTTHTPNKIHKHFVDNASYKSIRVKQSSSGTDTICALQIEHLIYRFYKYCFIPSFVTLSVDVATEPCFSLIPFVVLKMFCFAVELQVILS